jgi:hypothetical protein
MAQNGNCVLSQRSMGAALERREQGAGSVGIAFTLHIFVLICGARLACYRLLV